MTDKQIITMLKAELNCILKRSSAFYEESCANEDCDNCMYLYEQGTFGERKEMLKTLIKKLEK